VRVPTVAAAATLGAGVTAATAAMTLGSAGGDGPGGVLIVGGSLSFVVVGALLMHRRPGNPVGWLLGAYGALFTTNLALYEDVYRFQATGAASTFFGISTIAHAVLWLLGFAILALAVLLFPTGRLPSAHWRPVAALAAGGAVAVLASTILLWPQRGPELIDGPIVPPGAAGVAFIVAMVAIYPALVLAVVSLIVRYRRAGDEERQQLKWLLYALTVLVSGPVYFLVTQTGPGADGAVVGEVLTIAGMLGVPVAIGIAITKHRLYEIDRVISRTVVYAVISALLVAVYAGGVFLLTPVVAGMGGGSELAVAASTLAVAAAFGPVRRRVQDLVDRRFNRARYDAQRTVSGFAGRLRDEVHLEDLRAELVGVVDEVMEPASASLWLRERAVR
jgi:hypothetical protein